MDIDHPTEVKRVAEKVLGTLAMAPDVSDKTLQQVRALFRRVSGFASPAPKEEPHAAQLAQERNSLLERNAKLNEEARVLRVQIDQGQRVLDVFAKLSIGFADRALRVVQRQGDGTFEVLPWDVVTPAGATELAGRIVKAEKALALEKEQLEKTIAERNQLKASVEHKDRVILGLQTDLRPEKGLDDGIRAMAPKDTPPAPAPAPSLPPVTNLKGESVADWRARLSACINAAGAQRVALALRLSISGVNRLVLGESAFSGSNKDYLVALERELESEGKLI